MENIKKIYKLKLCTYYENGKCYKSKEECNYAHGKDDLREFEKECRFGLECFKEDCIFKHPEDWDYKNNSLYRKDDSCEIEYIDEKKEDNNKYIEDKKLDINNNNEFPFLKENNIKNIKNDNEDDNKDIQKNTEHIEINKNQDKYNNTDDKLFPDVKIFVDGVECNNSNNVLKINEDIKIKKIKEEYETVEDNHDDEKICNIDKGSDFLNEIQKIFEDFSKEFKNNIDETFIDDKFIYGVNIKLELNDIMSRISLLKNNYDDIINILKTD